MKKCTYCGKEYQDETDVCAIDGEPLEAIGSSKLPIQASTSDNGKRDKETTEEFRLVLVREKQINAGLVKWLVYVDKTPRGYLSNGKAISVPAGVGIHSLELEIGGTKLPVQDVTVPAGSHYLLRLILRAVDGVEVLESRPITQDELDSYAPVKAEPTTQFEQTKARRDAEKTLGTFALCAGGSLFLPALQLMSSNTGTVSPGVTGILITIALVFLLGGVLAKAGIATRLWAVLIIIIGVVDIVARIAMISQGVGIAGFFIVVGFLVDIGSIASGVAVLGQKSRQT